MPDGSTWQQITLFLFTLVVLILCAILLQPFFSAIVGAVVLAVITQRPYRWLASRIRTPNLCAATALVIVLLVVIIPAFLLAQELVQQAASALALLRSDATQRHLADFVLHHPTLANRIDAITRTIDPGNAARTSAAYLGTHLPALLGASVRFITELVIMLFLLFFLLRDRDQAVTFLRSLLPLHPHEKDELLHRLDDTIYATALGRLVMALIQGVLAGLAYWALGVPAPILWAFTTAVMALVPAFGTVLVWAPIAIYLGLSGSWPKAVILILWGGVIVSTIDNILYPILVGTRLRAHTSTILLSILGGIALFGITGVVLGPLIFTLASTLLDIWRNRQTPSISNVP
jgi:predicted PurR-regulated permease PerM